MIKKSPQVTRMNLRTRMKELKGLLDSRYSLPEELHNQTPFYARAERIWFFMFNTFELINERLDDIDKEIDELRRLHGSKKNDDGSNR